MCFVVLELCLFSFWILLCRL